MLTGDTIVAISSATGPAARMIVRLSGPDAVRFATSIAPSIATPSHATAMRVTLAFAGLQVPGAWLYSFTAPRSSTGEDVVELHLPGNALLAKLLVNHFLAGGARAADPGEFTARAYFNGKLDLTAAEGVAAAVSARSDAELTAARQLLAGELANRVRPIIDTVAETLALLEVGIDFSDEDVTFLSPSEVEERLAAATCQIASLTTDAARIEPLSHEPTVVLVGCPNAGKSTLLNALAGRERAVVSPVAGTTRDVISAEVVLRRGIVRMLDVAGLERQPPAADPSRNVQEDIERAMQTRARETIERADVVLRVDDVLAMGTSWKNDIGREADLTVITKADLPYCLHAHSFNAIHVSARTGQGLDLLRDRLDAICFGGAERATLTLNARHTDHLAKATASLERARNANANAVGVEVVALELRDALDELGAIVGSISPDELLGRVFSQFCIGK
jgi:tRNA modification GTPase